jgi:hypothetical protein
MDPWELPGLAHFCEHMLFLGTDKYPLENEYGKFISAHGGHTNAYTAADHTNYHFDIAPDHLLVVTLKQIDQIDYVVLFLRVRWIDLCNSFCRRNLLKAQPNAK